MTDNDDTLYKDLVGFLESNRADLREVAAEATLSTLTQNGSDAVLKLMEHGGISALCRLMTFPGKTGHDSLASLLVMTYCYLSPTSASMIVYNKSNETVDASSSPSSAMPTANALETKMMESNAIGRAMDVALSFTDLENDQERKHVFRAMALLANLTRNERGSAAFLLGGKKQLEKMEQNIEEEKEDVSPSVPLLFSRFLSDKYTRVEEEKVEKDIFDLEEEEEGKENDDEGELSIQDPYLHFGSVLTNITQINAGRNFITSMHNHTLTTSLYFKEDETEDKKTKMSSILPPTMKTLLFLLRTCPSKHRRRSIAATIKNCCFDTNISKLWILPLHKRNQSISTDEKEGSIIQEDKNFKIRTEDDMITSLLYPLAGPEEITEQNDLLLLDPILYSLGPDKKREKDSKTRFHIVETILLLCASGRQTREILRSKGAYVILKYADLVEDEEDIGEKINECVQFLKRDEEGMSEGESDNLALEMAKERRRIQEDYDGVD